MSKARFCRIPWLACHLASFHDADDLNSAQPFLPTQFAGHPVLTTRSQVSGKLARRLDVDTLDKLVEALLLLRRATLIEANAPWMHGP